MNAKTPPTELHIRLAREIVASIIDAEAPIGQRLKESELSEKLGVSRSPVRAALSLLAEGGVVEQRTNRGFVTALPAEKLAGHTLDLGETGSDALYNNIIADRVNNKLADVESEADLLRRYGVTRSLLNRVLTRLSQEGVVERSPGYGWRFSPALSSEAAHDESYAFRLLLEPAGPLQPTFQANPVRLSQAKAAHEKLLASKRLRLPEIELFRMNADFHEMLAEFSGNRFILQAIQQQNRLRQLLEYRGFQSIERVHQSCREHLEIIDAIERGENEWAASLLKRHLQVASGLKLGFDD
ncbi:MAG: GntR family transcriptional regulator [Pseudomonadota bacterium]